MHGNVWEWCSDHYYGNYEGAPEDGRAWIDEEAQENKNETKSRLLRGGSWYGFPRYCRSACRANDHPGYRDLEGDRYDCFGFRVCYLPRD